MTDEEGTKADTLKVCSSSGVNPTSTLMRWWLLLPAGPNCISKLMLYCLLTILNALSSLCLGFSTSIKFSLKDHFFAKSSDHAIV